MKKKLTNNIGLKILSLLCAVILWLIVVNIDDPPISVPFSGITVEIINADSLTDQGKVYEILENTDVVNVSIRGKRSYVETISKENIRAVADMNDLTKMDTIGIKVTSNKYNSQLDSITCDTEYVKLLVEDLRKIQKPIKVETVGEPEEGYIINSATANFNQVLLEGPESVMKEISVVKALVNVEGISGDISSSIELQFFDSEGSSIESGKIVRNIKAVTVNVSVLAKKEVPVVMNVTGKPADGYAMTGENVISVPVVSIAGRKAIIDKISALTINDDKLDVTDLTSNLNASVDLSQYLPANIIWADSSFDSKADIEIKIQKESYIVMVAKEDDIRIINVPEGLEAHVVGTQNEEGFTEFKRKALKIYGLSQNLRDIKQDSFVGTINIRTYMELEEIAELEPGIYSFEPDFGLPEGANLRENYEVQVEITKLAGALAAPPEQ